MMKEVENYPDPAEVVNKYGADALRWVGLLLFLYYENTITNSV